MIQAPNLKNNTRLAWPYRNLATVRAKIRNTLAFLRWQRREAATHPLGRCGAGIVDRTKLEKIIEGLKP